METPPGPITTPAPCTSDEAYTRFLLLIREKTDLRLIPLLWKVFRATFHLGLPCVRYSVTTGPKHGASHCVVLLAVYYALFCEKSVLVVADSLFAAFVLQTLLGKIRTHVSYKIHTLINEQGVVVRFYHPVDKRFSTSISIATMPNICDNVSRNAFHVLLVDGYDRILRSAHPVISPRITSLILSFTESQRSVITFSTNTADPVCPDGILCHNPKCLSISTFETGGAGETSIEEDLGRMSVQ